MYPLKKLSEICKIKTWKKDVNEGNPNGEFPFFTCAREHTFSDSYSFDMEALLVAGNGDVWHVQYYKWKFEAYQRTYILYDFSPEISVSYLFQYLGGFLKETVSKQKLGNTMPYIKLGMLTDFEIPLPPLSIQLDIVAHLDSAMAEIETLRRETESALASTRELWESTLEDIFASGGNDWEGKTLREITIHLGDWLHGTPKYTIDGDYYFINGNNLTDGIIEFKTSTKRVSIDEYHKHKKNLTDRTVLVSINGTLGNIAFYNGEKVILWKSACYFNLKEDINKYFIRYILSSPYFLKYAHKEATGATIKNVSLKTMREFLVPLPTLELQWSIVAHLDAVRAETERLEILYTEKLASLDELRRSVLAEAFV